VKTYLLFSILFSISLSLKADDVISCVEVQEKISTIKKVIEDKMKKGFDINEQVDNLNKLLTDNDRCIVA
jgi:hypothetical protein